MYFFVLLCICHQDEKDLPVRSWYQENRRPVEQRNMQHDWTSQTTDAGVSPARISWTLRYMRNNWSIQYATSFEIICYTSNTTVILGVLTAIPTASERSSCSSPALPIQLCPLSTCTTSFPDTTLKKKNHLFFSIVFNVSFSTDYFPSTYKQTSLTHTTFCTVIGRILR